MQMRALCPFETSGSDDQVPKRHIPEKNLRLIKCIQQQNRNTMVADKSLQMWSSLNTWEDYIKNGIEAKIISRHATVYFGMRCRSVLTYAYKNHTCNCINYLTWVLRWSPTLSGEHRYREGKIRGSKEHETKREQVICSCTNFILRCNIITTLREILVW
jgi:hypothetical protein